MVRGRAAEHHCVVCGGPGEHWALVADPVGSVSWSSKGRWSASVWDYFVVCAADHAAHDAALAVLLNGELPDANDVPCGVLDLLEQAGFALVAEVEAIA